MDKKLAEIPYAKWVEEGVKALFDMEPEAICLCAILPGGEVMTSYYECSVQDKVILAGNIHMDATLDTVRANRDMILAEEDDGEEGG